MRNASKISTVRLVSPPVNEEELRNLHKKFNHLDKDKSGCLEPNEFFDLPCTEYSLIYRTR